MIIISDMWDGKTRKLSSHNCLQCCEEFFAPLKAKAKYCSKKCNGLFTRTQIKISCSRCKKEFQRQLNRVKKDNYCGRLCKELDQQIGGPLALPHYKNGKYDYRSRAFRFQEKKCRQCGFDKDERMLDVHHIDSNRENGRADNLAVLCVWCHALYTRKILGPSPNWHGISFARKNSAGSTPAGSTNLTR
jgi:hypothetical protein